MKEMTTTKEKEQHARLEKINSGATGVYFEIMPI